MYIKLKLLRVLQESGGQTSLLETCSPSPEPRNKPLLLRRAVGCVTYLLSFGGLARVHTSPQRSWREGLREAPPPAAVSDFNETEMGWVDELSSYEYLQLFQRI